MSGLPVPIYGPINPRSGVFTDALRTVKPYTFGEKFTGALNYTLAPGADRRAESSEFDRLDFDPSFDFRNALQTIEPDYAIQFAEEFARAKNQKHFDFIHDSLQRNADRRKMFAETHALDPAYLLAGVFDPGNFLFFVPFIGQLGMAVKGGIGIGSAFARGAAGGLAAMGLSETLRAPYDPYATTSEVALNMGAAGVFGGVLGAAPTAFRSAIPGLRKSANETYNFLNDMDIDTSVGGFTIKETKAPGKLTYEDGVAVDKANKTIYIDRDILNNDYKFEKYSLPKKEKATIRKGAFESKLEYLRFKVLEAVEKSTLLRNTGETDLQFSTRVRNEAMNKTLQGYAMKKTAGNRSMFYSFLSTPTRRIMTDDKIPNEIKKDLALLHADGAMAFEGNVAGNRVAVQSIEARKARHAAKTSALDTFLRSLYTKETASLGFTPATNLSQRAKKLMGNKDAQTYEEFASDLIQKYIEYGDPQVAASRQLSDIEELAFEKLDKFFKEYNQEAIDAGIIPTKQQAESMLQTLDIQLDKVNNILDKITVQESQIGLTKKQIKFLKNLRLQQELLNEKIAYYRMISETGQMKRDFRFPLDYDTDALLANPALRQELTDMFEQSFRENPITKTYSKKTGKIIRVYSKEEAEIVTKLNKQVGIKEEFVIRQDPKEAAEEAVASIMGEKADYTFDMTPGANPRDPRRIIKNKHLMHRVHNIPEYKLAKFIKKDMSVLYKYSERMGNKLEWSRAFGGESIEDILFRHENLMRESGLSENKIRQVRTDFLVDYERVMRVHTKNPARLDTRIAKAFKELASTAYMGKAAISSIGDIGMIAMERGLLKNIMPLFSKENLQMMGLAKGDIENVVEGMRLFNGMAQHRFVNDAIAPSKQTKIERGITKMQDVYFNVPVVGNNLGLITKYLKLFDGIFRQSHLIELSVKAKNNKLTKFEIEYLQRHGLSIEDAQKIGAYSDIWQTGDVKGGNPFYHANLNEWPVETAAQRDLLYKFETALNIGVKNTIFLATTRDKPAIVDGVMYVKYRPAIHDKLGLVPDEVASTQTQKVVRIETGVMSLPFQFMSWTLAAMERIPMALMDPARQHRVAGVLTLLGASYLSLSIKKPDWWFESKDNVDIAQRIVDQSGIFSVYSDLYYMSLHLAAAYGAVPEDTEFFYGKYKADKLSAVTDFAGAAPGYVQDAIKAAKHFVDGQPDEGYDELKRLIPFGNTPTTQAIVNFPWGQTLGLQEDMSIDNLSRYGSRF